MGLADRLTPSQVTTPEKFARYCEQQTGIPYPTGKKIAMLKKTINEFFVKYPQANYITLCRIVEWTRAKRVRYTEVANMISGATRYAFADGYLPELDASRHPTHIDSLIKEAYFQETNEDWQRRLLLSETEQAKTETYQEWLQYRKSNVSAGNA